MILYYAVGGGLGHLTRARALVHTLGLHDQMAILTASPFALDRRVVDDLGVIRVPMEVAGDLPGYREWLEDLFAQMRPSAIYLDTFPAGILGEFCDFKLPDVPVIHIARLLRWEEYLGQLSGSPPALDTTYYVEELVPEHEAFVREHSREVKPLELDYPPAPQDDALKWILRTLTGDSRPLWVVVHSGPLNEIEELYAYAQELSAREEAEPRLLLIAPQRPPSLPEEVAHLDLYPAQVVFPYADRIITACGFNLMRQTEQYREKHRFMPFVRRFDDQFMRASRRRDAQ